MLFVQLLNRRGDNGGWVLGDWFENERVDESVFNCLVVKAWTVDFEG